MARFKYVVLSRSQPGREAEFIDWYSRQHLGDVAKIPGVVSVELVRLDFQRVYELDAPQWTLMTLYVLEGDDAASIIDRVRAASGTDAMPMSDALTKAGMIQAAGQVIAAIGTSAE